METETALKRVAELLNSHPLADIHRHSKGTGQDVTSLLPEYAEPFTPKSLVDWAGEYKAYKGRGEPRRGHSRLEVGLSEDFGAGIVGKV